MPDNTHRRSEREHPPVVHLRGIKMDGIVLDDSLQEAV
jgi:hypothetical protein